MPGLGVAPLLAPERAAQDQPLYALCPLHNVNIYICTLDNHLLSLVRQLPDHEATGTC